MNTPERFARRRQQLRKLFKSENVAGMLITAERNVTWLTGFTGDSTYLFLGPDGDLLLSDFRYITQLEEECPGVETFIRKSTMKMPEAVLQVIGKSKVERLGIEGHAMTVELFQRLQEELKGVSLTAVNWKVEELRSVKDPQEIEEIREAVRLAERGFDFLKAILTPEKTECELAHELEHAIRGFGGDGLSFPAIIAVGDRAALPHYRPGTIKLKESPILLVDWGAMTKSGYRSDLTRTMLTGKPDRKFQKIYETVLEAQRLSIEAIAPGVKCGDVDAVARDFIKAAGYGKYFDHGLGHGIGLDIHELPRFSQGSETELKPGMVVTVEPGIYLPGWGGVRIEDDVLVTKQG
ncbi:MAG: aminopeptidase P family protein, partial [Planctomycetaceae bacterium]|nr:aminopeptidase P family protein [Planctomycetaceae bacterium]